MVPVCRSRASFKMSITSVANSRALNRANFCLPCTHTRTHMVMLEFPLYSHPLKQLQMIRQWLTLPVTWLCMFCEVWMDRQMSVTTSTRPQLCIFARSEWTGKCLVTPTRCQLCISERPGWTGKCLLLPSQDLLSCMQQRGDTGQVNVYHLHKTSSAVCNTRPPQLCATEGWHWTGKCLLSPSQDLLSCMQQRGDTGLVNVSYHLPKTFSAVCNRGVTLDR